MHAEPGQERAMNDPGLQAREHQLWLAIIGRGAAGALTGLLLLANPFRSPRAIGGIFAAYVLIDGLLSLYSASRAMRSARPSWAAIVVGVIDAVAAVVALAMPAVLPLRLAGGVRA